MKMHGLINLNSLSRFWKSIGEWAESRKNIDCVLLVGSYARGEQTEDSDIDLMILTENVDEYLTHNEWISEFGNPRSIEREDWGDVQSVRVRYTDSKEIEFGIASPSWLTDPLPVTTAEVLEGGYNELFGNTRFGILKPGYYQDHA